MSATVVAELMRKSEISLFLMHEDDLEDLGDRVKHMVLVNVSETIVAVTAAIAERTHTRCHRTACSQCVVTLARTDEVDTTTTVFAF